VFAGVIGYTHIKMQEDKAKKKAMSEENLSDVDSSSTNSNAQPGSSQLPNGNKAVQELDNSS
jgi:hypothetical protein